MPELHDSFGRRVDYLRISVTDRCNLRCAYCMPASGVSWKPRQDLLSASEIERVVRAAAGLGIRRVRLTGGEPLARPDLVALVRALARIDGIEEISLTTNGMLLERLAAPLAAAGLKRVNVSLDSLRPETFRRLTRFGEIERLWRGLAAAERAGLAPIKLNTVVIRGVNDDELADFAALTLSRPWHVRFIELMPVGNLGDWGEGFPPQAERYYSIHEMLAQLRPLGLTPCAAPAGNGPARVYRIPGAAGTIGFISPLGEHFCETCNRLRLTADGRLRPCLLREGEIDARDVARRGGDVAELIHLAAQRKPIGHALASAPGPVDRMMCQIGG